MLKKSTNILILNLVLLFSGFAQQYPTSATVIMVPPHPVYVSDYYGIGSSAFQTILNLNDLNELTWDVRLKITIEGEGIKLESKQTYIPSFPITLTAGIPTTLSGSDFAGYFDINNLNLEGITTQSLTQSGKLPEGLYNFCVEILDYQTGTSLSLTSCQTVFIFFEPPPVILQPACEDVLTPSSPQNVYLAWQIAGGASPAIAMGSKYQISLYEVTDLNDDPYFAVENNHALLIFESDFINQTSYTINMASAITTPLVAGKKYVWRVRAVDAEEKDIYRNNGFSEWCWFFYGYPSNGVIATQVPANNHVFGKYENKSFGWSASDLGIPGQQYEYSVTLKEVNENQDIEDAMELNSEWYQQSFPVTSSMNGYSFTLNQDFTEGAQYVWQVTAYTGTQEVAKSEVSSFYAPSLVDQFLAGGKSIDVVSLSGTDLSDVSGIGQIQLSDDPTDLVQFDFEHFNIEDMAGSMVLIAGEAIFDISDRDSIALTPNNAENGNAHLHFIEAKVNTGGLKVKSQVIWKFPHATSSGNVEYLPSKEAWLQVSNSNTFSGDIDVLTERTYELLEPSDFQFKIKENSTFLISNNNYTLRLQGNIATNSTVKTNNQEPYFLNFTDQNSVYYLEVNGLLNNATNYLKPIDDFGLGLRPKKAIIDLSETTSPGKLSGLPNWKGIYFPEFLARFEMNVIDESDQLKLYADIDRHETLDGDYELWLSNQGLHCLFDFDLTETGTTFNGFKTELAGELTVNNNDVENSKLTGSIRLPVIHKTDLFDFEIPLSNSGLMSGYLNEDLTNRDLVFNPYGGENRVNITINRAVFEDHERLDLEIDAELVGIDAIAAGIDNFRIYGDNSIGIGAKNGAEALTTQVTGEYKGFTAVVTTVGAALYNGSYVFSYETQLDMGSDVSGQNGPPIMAVSSVEPVGNSVELPAYTASNPQPVPTIAVPDDIEENQASLTVKEMYIAIDNPLVEVSGYLKLTDNDPNWGTSFHGGIDGALKIPARIEVGAHMIFGDRDGVKFWYFDAYFNDTEGLGVQVPPFFNVVAMEGRVFRHMSKNETEYVVDPDLAFGAALYLQLIDNSQQGALFAIDAGAEIAIQENGDFIFSISGDGSFLNTNRRSAVGGVIASEVAEVVVEEVMDAVGPIEFTQEIGGGTLTVVAESLTKGSLNYLYNGTEFGFGADVGGTPAVDFNYSKDDASIEVGASANGDFNIAFAKGSDNVSLGMSGSNLGYLNLDYEGVVIESAINRSDETGNLKVGYDSKSIEIGKTTSGGYLDLVISDDINFKTGFDSQEQSGYLGLKYESNEFDISGNQSTGEGHIALKVDGADMNFDVNATEKSGSFSLNTGNTSIAASAVAEKNGSFSYDDGSVSCALAVDMENQSGSIDYSYDQGNKQFHAEVTDGNEGALKLIHNDIEFSMHGTTDGEKGGIAFKSGSDRLEIEADKPNSTGRILYDVGGNFFEAKVQADSGSVEYKNNGTEFTIGATDQGSGGVIIKHSGKELQLYGDIVNETSSINFIDGADQYMAATDLQNNTHSMLVKSNNDEYELQYSPTNQLARYKQGTELEVYAKNDDGDYEVGVQYQQHEITGAYKNSVRSVNYVGLGADVYLSDVEFQIQYDGHSLYVSETEIKIDGSTLRQIANSVTFSHSETMGDITAQLTLAQGDLTVSFSKSGATITMQTDLSFQDGRLTLNYSGKDYAIFKQGDQIGAAYEDYLATYENGIAHLEKGTEKQITASANSLELKYNNYEMAVNETSFTYQDGTNSAEVGTNLIKVTRDSKEVYITDTEFGVKLANDKSLILTQTSAEIQYEDYQAGFAMDSYVHFSDGTRNFALSQTGLEMSDDSRSLALLDDNGTPSIRLTNNDDLFELSKKGFAVEYAGKRYAINEEEDLKIEIDSDKYLLLKMNEGSYVQGETSLIVGGETNFLELKHQDKSIALTQEDKIQYSDDTYTAWLSKDLEAEITDGDRTIGIFSSTHYLTYEQGDYGFGIRGGSGGNKPGIDFTAYNNTMYIEGERNVDVTAGVISPDYGEINFSVKANKDFEARYINGSDVYGFKKGDGIIIPIMGTEPEPPTPEYLAGSGSVEATDGPQYLTNSVSDAAGGTIRGKVEMSFNSATSHLVANAAVEGTSPVCIKGAMALDVSPSRFKLDIGTEAERIQIFPTCSGFGGGGWLGIESTAQNTSASIGVFMGWEAHASVSIGSSTIGASLSVDAGAELGISAQADVYPDFHINEAKIWVDIHAGIYASYWCVGASGSITIAAVAINGELTARFKESSTQVSGTLNGSINILDIVEESFSAGFNAEF